jgi:putative component of membrane protein insertase Oxa1/YidC/SpoIIIJ protein YidD
MIKFVLLQCVKIYQAISMVFHAFCGLIAVDTQCKFPESCSRYALRQLNKKDLGSFQAVQRIALRLLMCSPLYGLWVKE